jgi:sirohydrochlorin ferrochelatase
MPRRTAVLIVDHGSRLDEANELVVRVADRIRERLPDDLHVAHAHMEIAEPTFFDGVAACVAAGATDIVVHPYFLGDGRHTRETIPELVREAERRHEHVTIRVSAHLGLHDKLLDVVLERIDEALDR